MKLRNAREEYIKNEQAYQEQKALSYFCKLFSLFLNIDACPKTIYYAVYIHTQSVSLLILHLDDPYITRYTRIILIFFVYISGGYQNVRPKLKRSLFAVSFFSNRISTRYVQENYPAVKQTTSCNTYKSNHVCSMRTYLCNFMRNSNHEMTK
uniref:Uncharacterized protein n=1 Tax=Glossina brevipalpis TaxID=37001 RepID=A0A1A9VZJ7_9MUSC